MQRAEREAASASSEARVQRRGKGTRKKWDEGSLWGLTLIQRFSFHQLIIWLVVWGQRSCEIKVGLSMLFFSYFFLSRLFSSDLDQVWRRWGLYLPSEACREVERRAELLMTSTSPSPWDWPWFWDSRRGVLQWHRCKTEKWWEDRNSRN